MENLMPISEAARMIGISAEMLRRMFDQGRVRGIRCALGRLLEREDVERLAKERATRLNARRVED